MKYLFLALAVFLTSCVSRGSDSVVSINNGVGKGSGFVAYSDDQVSGIITNLHVCSTNFDKATKNKTEFLFPEAVIITVQNNIYRGQIITFDIHNDLCFIEVFTPLKALNVIRRSNLAYNEPLILRSPYPYGSRLARFVGQDNSQDEWTAGHSSSYVIRVSDDALMHGQSGSPIFDRKNNVVMVFWGLQQSVDKEGNKLPPDVGFAIGNEALYNFLHKSKPHLMKYTDKPEKIK